MKNLPNPLHYFLECRINSLQKNTGINDISYGHSLVNKNCVHNSESIPLSSAILRSEFFGFSDHKLNKLGRFLVKHISGYTAR